MLYGGFGNRDYEFLFWQPLDNVAVLVDNQLIQHSVFIA